MEQFAGFYDAPPAIVVHAFTGDDDGAGGGEGRAVSVNPVAVGLQGVAVGTAARVAFEDDEFVRGRVSQCPHVRGCCDDQVEAADREVLCYPDRISPHEDRRCGVWFRW